MVSSTRLPIGFHSCRTNMTTRVSKPHDYAMPRLILGLHPANERRRYFVTTSLIGWAQAYNQPCMRPHMFMVCTLFEFLNVFHPFLIITMVIKSNKNIVSSFIWHDMFRLRLNFDDFRIMNNPTVNHAHDDGYSHVTLAAIIVATIMVPCL